MDDTKPITPTPTDRVRLAGIIWSVTRAQAPLLAITMALCALMLLPLIPSIVRGEVGVREIVALTLVVALAFLVMFVFLVVPHVLMDWFGFDEWARTRWKGKQASVDLRPFFAGLGRIFRPVLPLFTWWRPFKLGRFGEVVLLPDSMALFVVGILVVIYLSAWLPASLISPGQFAYFWLYLPLLVPAVLVSPFVLTAVLWVSREEVRLVRFFVVIPYWVHRVPHDAEFDLSDSWDGPVFTRVGFTSRSRSSRWGIYELDLGTTTSASRLYRHISAVLERAGWKRSPSGFLSPAPRS